MEAVNKFYTYLKSTRYKESDKTERAKLLTAKVFIAFVTVVSIADMVGKA